MFDEKNSPYPLEDFYKHKESDPIWTTGFLGEDAPSIGPFLFSFDCKTVFNFWEDYPDNLTPDQVEIFNKWNPYMAKLRGFGKPGWDKSGK